MSPTTMATLLPRGSEQRRKAGDDVVLEQLAVGVGLGIGSGAKSRSGSARLRRARAVSWTRRRALLPGKAACTSGGWLLPRIDRFQALGPAMDIRLDTSLKLAGYVAQGSDVVVRYGAGHWPGLKAEKLMDEEVFPMASPRLLETVRIERPADLAAQP